jgi:hypothetical protein
MVGLRAGIEKFCAAAARAEDERPRGGVRNGFYDVVGAAVVW